MRFQIFLGTLLLRVTQNLDEFTFKQDLIYIIYKVIYLGNEGYVSHLNETKLPKSEDRWGLYI